MKLYIRFVCMLSNIRERSRSPMERDRSPVRGRPVTGFADARSLSVDFFGASWTIMMFLTSSWIAWVGILVFFTFYSPPLTFCKQVKIKSSNYNVAASGSTWTLNPKKESDAGLNQRLMLKYSFQYEFTRVLSQIPLCVQILIEARMLIRKMTKNPVWKPRKHVRE